MKGSTTYAAVPIQLVETLDVQQGFEVQRAYDLDTGCLITCLHDDYDLFAEHR
jgi:hypothetical protein